MHAIALLLLLSADPGRALPEDLSFLQGCWAGESGDEYLEERYGGQHAGVMLGHIKVSRNGKLQFFKFLQIYIDAGGTWLQPYPRGRDIAPRYALVELEADKATFENKERDFPRRITYRLLPNGQLFTQTVGTVDGVTVVEEHSSSPRPCSP